MDNLNATPLLVQPGAEFLKPPPWRHWLVPIVINVVLVAYILVALGGGIRFAIAPFLLAGGLMSARTYWTSGALGSGQISLLDGRVRDGNLQLAGLASVMWPRRWVTFDGGGTLTMTRKGAEGARAYTVTDGRSTTGFRSAIDWDLDSAAALVDLAHQHGYVVKFEG